MDIALGKELASTTARVLLAIIVILLFVMIKSKSTEVETQCQKPDTEFMSSCQEIDLNKKNQICHQFPNNSNGVNIALLDDISSSKPDKRRSVFFLITTCLENGKIALKPRQACAIESAALHNPNRKIFALFTSPAVSFTDQQSETVSVLQTYTNIHFMNVNLETFVKGTPAENFYQSRELFSSKYLIVHMSDFLRLLVLYQYGGIYLDTDVVVQKSIDELPENFLGKEAHRGHIIDNVNSAVIGFQDEIGHEISELFLKEFLSNYKPNEWGYNGPKLFTRVLKREVCNTSLAEMTPEKCRGLRVFSPKEFYAINYDDWSHFFNVNFTKIVLEATKNSSIVHLWNAITHGTIITKSKSKTAYEVIAEKNCPKAFNTSGKYF